ncbi:MAG: sulfurtransferase TusE [SAR86 cluster bacterium]|uniref:Sulfurtransferase n=1 Tax=SAR86 cluster bacterium TaxID=2030880 RepID=A0A2A5B3K3_9GAMM|nr:MAG: sulfurtransferase TusE [SAR86 cluster bacterium]
MNNFLNIHDSKIPLDKEGYLKDLQDWNEEVASELAAKEDIVLGASHWEILKLLRVFHKRHRLSPATRALISLVKRELGNHKGRSVYLMKLFRGSPARTACKLAGLPRPDNCL